MKKLKKIDLNAMANSFSILSDDDERKVVGGYTEEEAFAMMDAGSWTGGYVDGYGYMGPVSFVFGHDGKEGSTNYYGSSSDFTRSLKVGLWDSLAGNLVPTGTYQDYMENIQLEATATLQDLGYNGPVYVETIYSPSNRHTDISLRIIVYSGQTGDILFDSNNISGFSANGSEYGGRGSR